MKKTIVAVCVVGLAIGLFVQPGVLNAILLFLLVGAIPGTSHSVPAGVMLVGILSTAWLIVFRFMAREVLYLIADKRIQKHGSLRKARMPKRRFEQL